MKVENIRNSYLGYGCTTRKNNAYIRTATPSFGNSPASTAARSIEDILKSIFPNRKALNFINKFENLKGELGGILITAVGTGFVAPFSIAFNPFVKAKPDATEEEKEELSKTKKYTAMRQPISAVLAAIFQAGALGPIDRFLDKLSNDPEYAKNFWLELDQSAIQKKEYIARLIKKEMKNDPETAKLSKKEFKKELDARVKARQAEQLNAIAESIQKTGEIKIGERALANSEVAEYVNNVIENYIQKARKLQNSAEGLSYYTKRATDLINNKDILNDILSEDKLTSLRNKPKELKNYLLSIRNKPEYAGVQEILDEIIVAPEQIRESRCYRTIARIQKIEEACGGTFTPERYLEKLTERNDLLDEKIAELKGAKIEDLSKATKESIKETIGKVAQACVYDENSAAARDIFENTNTFQNDLEKLGAKVRKDIAKFYKEVLEHKYKGFSQITKVLIGVCITLPITCSALNWVYPRFMAKFFPNLAKTDNKEETKNGGDK